MMHTPGISMRGTRLPLTPATRRRLDLLVSSLRRRLDLHTLYLSDAALPGRCAQVLLSTFV